MLPGQHLAALAGDAAGDVDRFNEISPSARRRLRAPIQLKDISARRAAVNCPWTAFLRPGEPLVSGRA
jgi:hypothetical protein